MTRPIVECWCCGRDEPHCARGLCRRCWHRWQDRGFTGPGPGPERIPRAERAAERLAAAQGLTDRQAAERIGVTMRTLVRDRRVLAEAS